MHKASSTRSGSFNVSTLCSDPARCSALTRETRETTRRATPSLGAETPTRLLPVGILPLAATWRGFQNLS